MEKRKFLVLSGRFSVINEVYKTIHAHKSVRKYKKQIVAPETLNRILEAATRASTSGNMQCYSIIVTQDDGMKQQLLAPHFNQSMVTEAPVLLTFCADFNRMRKWIEISDAPQNFDNFMSFMIASIDAILASQNAALAAESEGLGICYMGTTLASCNRIAEILNCPANVVPVVGFSLGYADDEAPVRERLPQSAVIHYEKYHDYTANEIKEHYRAKETSGFKRYTQIPELNELVEKHGLKNLAQVYTVAKYTRESHVGYSKTVLKFLKSQNFFEHEIQVTQNLSQVPKTSHSAQSAR